MIPRPETESLVEKVLMKAPHTGRFADLCTGSGCIALSLLMENERYTAIGTDTSPGALRWAWLNTRRYRMHGRLLLWHSFDPGWMPCRARSLDFIVANPPYIPSARLAELMTDVRDYEPHVALDGGEDGLDLLFGVLRAAVSLLKEGGLLFCETGGEDQLQALGLAVPRPLELAEVFEDGFGVARHAVFKKSTS